MTTEREAAEDALKVATAATHKANNEAIDAATRKSEADTALEAA